MSRKTQSYLKCHNELLVSYESSSNSIRFFIKLQMTCFLLCNVETAQIGFNRLRMDSIWIRNDDSKGGSILNKDMESLGFKDGLSSIYMSFVV